MVNAIDTAQQISRTYSRILLDSNFIPIEQHLLYFPRPQPLATTILFSASVSLTVLFYLYFWLCDLKDLSSQPGIAPWAHSIESSESYPLTTREFLNLTILDTYICAYPYMDMQYLSL